MQLYVIETACVRLPALKTSKNSNKLEKKLNPSDLRDVYLKAG